MIPVEAPNRWLRRGRLTYEVCRLVPTATKIEGRRVVSLDLFHDRLGNFAVSMNADDAHRLGQMLLALSGLHQRHAGEQEVPGA